MNIRSNLKPDAEIVHITEKSGICTGTVSGQTTTASQDLEPFPRRNMLFMAIENKGGAVVEEFQKVIEKYLNSEAIAMVTASRFNRREAHERDPDDFFRKVDAWHSISRHFSSQTFKNYPDSSEVSFIQERETFHVHFQRISRSKIVKFKVTCFTLIGTHIPHRIISL
jgi:hypothetical protein